MDKIENVEILPLVDSKYVTPYRMNYTQNGVAKTWEALKEHESVCILIYNKTRDCFVFVSQFRPAVYCSAVRHDGGETERAIDTDKYPGSLGVTFELCAGIVDKAVSSAEIAKMEVLEECGYDVPVESLEVITSYRSGVGISGSHQTLFYATVTDAQRVGPGGGLAEEGEFIHVHDIPVPKAKKLITDCTLPLPVELKFATGVGSSGSYQTMYYCEVTDDQIATPGGGIGTEVIVVVYVGREKAYEELAEGVQENMALAFSLKYGLLWFRLRKDAAHL